jgi:hypothetical protein
MSRTKTKVAKYTVSVNAVQDEALKKLMSDDMQENVSTYFGMMIAEITRCRAGNQRRAVGRPKKSEAEGEEEKWYPCPYDENAPPYTMDDLKAYYEFRGMPVPPQPPPYTKEQLKKWDM